MLAAGIVGFIVGVICVLAGLDRRMARLMDFGAGFAVVLAATMHPISASLVGRWPG